MVSSRPGLGAVLRGAKPICTHGGWGATTLGKVSRSRHSGSFGSFEGVGFLDTRSGYHSDKVG